MTNEFTEADLEYVEQQEREHIEDLEARGFYHGTCNTYRIEQIEAGERFDDLYEMYRNEY